MKRKISNKPLTWETLGVDTVSLPPLTETTRLVEDIQARVDMVVPSVNEGQFVRIWSTEIQNDPRRQPFEFLLSIFENHVVADTILAFIPGTRVEFPFQGNWGNGIGQLNPACSGELYVGRGTMQTQESSKFEKFLLGRVMDGVLYVREYHFSPEGFFEAQRGVAKLSQSEFETHLNIFSWPVNGDATPGIEKKTCILQVKENFSDVFGIHWLKVEYEIEFMKDCPVEFVLAKQVDVDIYNRYRSRNRRAENVWRPVEGPCAKSFFPREGCIFPVVNHIKGSYRMSWDQSHDYRKRFPIMVQGEVYIINSEFVKKQEKVNNFKCSYDSHYSCGLESYCRVHVKASYDKDAIVESLLLTKQMKRIFNRRKFVPKADNLSTRSDNIRENLKMLALVSGSKATFVEELTNKCKITEERAEEIYEDVKVDVPTTKKAQFYYCSVWGEWKVLEGAACRKKEDTNSPPPPSISILGSRDVNVLRRKRRKSRKTKAFSKSYQAKKERKNARKNRKKQRTLARKEAREEKLALFESERSSEKWWCWGWDVYEDHDDEESHLFYEAESTTVKEMYDWFRQGFTTSRHVNKAKCVAAPVARLTEPLAAAAPVVSARSSSSASLPDDEARYVKELQEDIAEAHAEKMESLTVDVQLRKPKRKSPKSWPTREKQDASRKRRLSEKLRTRQRKADRDYKTFNLVRN